MGISLEVAAAAEVLARLGILAALDALRVRGTPHGVLALRGRGVCATLRAITRSLALTIASPALLADSGRGRHVVRVRRR